MGYLNFDYLREKEQSEIETNALRNWQVIKKNLLRVSLVFSNVEFHETRLDYTAWHIYLFPKILGNPVADRILR